MGFIRPHFNYQFLITKTSKTFKNQTNPISKMNTFTTQLTQQQTLQSFLLKTIEYLHKYFKTISLQSEQKTYASINKICSKLQSKFSQRYAIDSLAKKLCLNVETKIKDKQDDVESNSKQANNKKKTSAGMKSFITNIQSAIENQPLESLSPELPPTEAPTRLPSNDSEYSWIRKTVLEQLELLKDDILEADDKIDLHLETCLGKNLVADKKFVLLFESFTNNKSIIEKIINLGWIPIIVRNQKKPPSQARQEAGGQEAGKKQQKIEEKQQVKEISIMQISSYMHKCHSVLISSDCILKTGGILSPSGSLMLAIMSRRHNIPVIIISRNYCLSDKILLNQRSLTTSINPAEYFKISHNDFGLYITKENDFIEPKYISLMVTERGCWMTEEISHVQDQYWSY